MGTSKIILGTGATIETGGLAAGLGVYTAYSRFSNLVSGASELYGGISGNVARGEAIGNYASAFGSISGSITLAVTGNPEAGARASAIEGIGTIGLTGGLVSTGALEAPSGLENAVTALEVGGTLPGLLNRPGCH